jgi:hypothetical protein
MRIGFVGNAGPTVGCQLHLTWTNQRSLCKAWQTTGTWHGNPNQLFCAPTYFHVRGPEDRLVSLSFKHIRSNIRCRIRNLPSLDAERSGFGSMAVAECYSTDPRIGCATRFGQAAFGGSRDYHFHSRTSKPMKEPSDADTALVASSLPRRLAAARASETICIGGAKRLFQLARWTRFDHRHFSLCPRSVPRTISSIF